MMPTLLEKADQTSALESASGFSVSEPAGISGGSDGARAQPPPEVLESAQPTRNDWRSSWQILNQHDFRLYFFGSLISNLGTWLQSTAQVLIAYQVTHSVFTVGLIASAQFAGMVVVSPWAPVLAYRLSSRAVLIGTQCASALLAAGMAWRHFNGVLGVHSLLFGALGLGFAYALALPVQTALVPALVPEEAATDAVKMNSVSYNAGRALAPALCVLVIALIGPGLIFALNAISFVIFAVFLRRLKRIADDISLRKTFAVFLGRLGRAIANLLRVTAPGVGPARMTNPAGEMSAKTPPMRPHARVTDGLVTALRHRRLLLLLAIVAAVTLADDPILVLSPALAHAKLHMSSAWAGYFIAALGWGSVLGSLPPTSSKDNGAQRASRRAAVSLLFLGVSVVLFTIGFSVQFSLGAAIVAGAAGLFTGTAAQTALLRHQKKTGAGVATVASVAALWAIAWAGTKPFASFLDGWLASHIGIVFTSIALASPAVIIALCELLLPEFAKRTIIDCADRLLPTPIGRGTEPPPRSNGVSMTNASPAANRVDHDGGPVALSAERRRSLLVELPAIGVPGSQR
jgi:MFS family permease